jgi:hypothetical protein
MFSDGGSHGQEIATKTAGFAARHIITADSSKPFGGQQVLQ